MSMIFLGISAVSAENNTQTTVSDSGVLTSDNAATSDVSKSISTKIVSEDTTSSVKSNSNNVKSKEITTNTNATTTQKSIKQASKTTSKMSVTNKTTKYNTNVQLTATVINKKTGNYATDGKVTFKVNNTKLATSTVSKGKAYYKYSTSKLTPKKYEITATYTDSSTLESSTAKGYLQVNKQNSMISIQNKKITVGNKVQFVATVVDSNTKNYISGGKVAFKVNSKTVGYGTVSRGKAYYTYDSSKLGVKSYKLTVVYGGTSKYTKASSNGYLHILSPASKITLSNKSVYAGNTVQLVATIVDKNTNKYISGGKVAFKINGNTVAHVSVSNGKAYYNYNSQTLDKGTYKLTATYSGNNIYDSSKTTTTATLKVLKNTFTYAQIKEAAVYVRNQYESNHIIKTVTVASTTMSIEDFLPLMIHMAKNINNGKSSTNVEYQHYASISTQTDTMKSSTLKTSQILSIGSKVLKYYQTYSKPPAYISTSWGKFGYNNLVYTYTKLIDVSTTKYLPSTCKIYNWNTIHPKNVKSRTIVISTDNIYTKTKDTAFAKSIKTILEKKGFTVKLIGVGPNTHNAAIWENSLPANAIQLSIFGGADAGVIYDVCTRSFMRTKANRLIFFAYHPGTSIDITGLKWLKRAHDDNYSPKSFTGIAYPDKYLKSHGYDYVYSSNANTIANALIKYVSG